MYNIYDNFIGYFLDFNVYFFKKSLKRSKKQGSKDV